MDLGGADLVRVLWSDLHGVARGKEVTVEEFERVVTHGVGFCQALMLTDLAANPLDAPETSGGGWPDAVARPDVTTLIGSADVALCLADISDTHGEPLTFSPRDILRAQVARYTECGLSPVVGPELEFYLCRRDSGGWAPYGERDTAGYMVGTAHDPEGMISQLLRRCRAMGLGVTAGNHEFSGGQFELNQHHSDALDAADRAFLFKYVVKEVASAHGLLATFMGKPFNDRAGNGCHLHVSLVDPSGPPPLDAFLAGILAHAPALTALLNPTITAYKRLGDGLAPVTANWGPDDRTAYVRIPPEGGRVEVRGGDGSANLYLAIAAVLAAGFDGIQHDLKPPAPGEGDPLPKSLPAALDALEDDKILVAGLGPRFVELFAALKRAELARFARTVTDWEFREYSWLL
ncbi:glutamine synthetase family protein [Amycolatopsis sp. NPDC059657]|uniref:glutamine synthetase family protein n=1 Tax=Amycolatopsis sp. NPDC059657 TaxID=3346899 RepID=UPI00366E846B